MVLIIILQVFWPQKNHSYGFWKQFQYRIEHMGYPCVSQENSSDHLEKPWISGNNPRCRPCSLRLWQEPRNFWSSESWSPVLGKSTDYRHWDFLKLHILSDSEWCVAHMLKLDSRGQGVAGTGTVWGFGLRGHCTAFQVYKLPTAAVLAGWLLRELQAP